MAGVVIAQEAGANVFGLDRTPYTLTSSATIATGPKLTEEIQELVEPLYTAPSGE